MPDDIMEGQVAEQVSDKAFGEGFKDDPVQEDKGQQPEKQEAQPAEKPIEKPSEEKPAGQAEEPKTAQERMEKLAQEKEAPANDGQGQQQQQAPPPAEAKPAEEKSAQGGNWIMDLIKSPEVSGTKIGVAGKEMTIAEFAEEYPEAVQAPVAIARIMVEKAMKEIQEKAVAEIKAVRAELGNLKFWDGVQQSHSDARKVAASAEFKAWVGKQPPWIAKMVTSENVADAVSVLDAFKESAAKAVKSEKDKEAAKRKEARDGLHGESLRGVGGAATKEGVKDQDDFDAGFNKA
jgi:hypothetical protein